MRPPGEVRLALLDAARESVYVDADGKRRGGTLQELARRAKVGAQAALTTVKNMRRAGDLEPVAERRVDYRNKPVIEWAPRVPQEQAKAEPDVSRVFALWVQG